MKNWKKLFLLLPVLLLSYGIWSLHNYFSCQEDVISVLPGPGRADAYVISEICYSASTRVQIRDKPYHNQDVLQYSSSSDTIIVKWIDAEHLDITVPKIDSVGFEVSKWWDLNITHHFGEIEN